MAQAGAQTKSGTENSADESKPFKSKVVREGVSVEFSLQHNSPQSDQRGTVREGDNFAFKFTITDATTGTPLRNVHPAAWVNLRPDAQAADAQSCSKKVSAFISGNLMTRPALDLNAYYVLALNQDSTITVVDPLFGFGGSKLLAMVFLESPGEDWAFNFDQSMLFVTMPASDRVAVVDTVSWKVIANVDVGPHPVSAALQPDGKYLWVSYGSPAYGSTASSDNNSGVAAIDCRALKVAARIPTGRGAHAIALSKDSRFAFVTNMDDGTVSIIDASRLEKIKNLKVGDRPAAIAFSETANTAYVSNAGDGSIVAISGVGAKVVARIETEAGAGQIKFARGGRFGFVPNPSKNLVHILDVATNRIIQTADIDRGPDQIAFSDTLAYVRRRDSEIVMMIPLDAIGKEGGAVPAADFPGGQAPFGKVSRPGLADMIVQAPGENAVLVANPADRAIYYYKEGMAAPMGSFNNYSREPRAVLVIDRSLREQSPGVYITTAQLKQSGNYDVVFFVNTPRVVHCFDVSIATGFDLSEESRIGRVIVQPLIKERGVKVDETVRLQFRLIDENTKQPRSDLRDVSVLTYLAPGIWQKRQAAEQVGEGIYEVRFIPPKPGFYYVFIESMKAGLRLNNSQFLILEAKGSS